MIIGPCNSTLHNLFLKKCFLFLNTIVSQTSESIWEKHGYVFLEQTYVSTEELSSLHLNGGCQKTQLVPLIL